MDSRSAELLELPAILARLAALTSFDAGRTLALGLRPSPDPVEVARRRALTEEGLRLRELGVDGPAGAADLREATVAAARGAVLEPSALVEVLATAGIARDARAAVAAHGSEAPLLAGILGPVDDGSLARVEGALARALDPRGGLLDTASPELAAVRRRLAAARREAIELLRRLAGSLRPHLQEAFTTERAGRPVLAVRASARSSVPGIVHDSSGSGQTLFIEPMPVVEANNRVRELAAQEAEEEERILRELSRLVGEERAALDGAVEALAVLDLALAAAALARAWDAVPVEPADEVDLAGARHPLLDPATAVPVDMPLSGLRALIISGPNTGGKTVALKTLGLLALCHQCGLRAPARRARLPVFDEVLADIGDDQSIAESLSTFSAHVRRLMRIMAAAGPASLVLLDEVAGGTDPREGGRLARAVIERLMERGALVLATTHHPELKEWAGAAPGAANAAVGVDTRALRPLYALTVGEPGASHALGIAERLGLDPDVVAAAREAAPPGERRLEGLLADAAAARAAAEEERAAARAEREAAARARARAQEREAELARRLERAREEAEAERAGARRAAEAELEGLSRELAALRAEIAAARREEAARARAARRSADAHARERDRRLGAASAAAARARAAMPAPRPPAAPGRPVEVGDRVLDPAMGFRGTVVALERGSAEVQGPSARVRVPAARLVVDRSAPPPAEPPPPRLSPAVAAAGEVDVRGMRAEEARALVRERMDAASMAGRPEVRVIHGRGTGALRAAVREELRRHPLVARADTAPPGDGGDGATIAYLGEPGAPADAS